MLRRTFYMDFDILPLLLALVGGYLLIKLRFFFILHPIRTARRGLRAIRDRRTLRSFSLALAGTLGVGNVFGVAIGILVGGAGSLFWLFVSMLFAMVIKYAEVVLTSDNLFHDTDTHGGFYYVIRMSFSRLGGALSSLYALIILLLSLVMGAALQTDAVTEALAGIVDFPTVFPTFFLAFIILLGIAGGTRRIEKITSVVIPITTIVYIFLTFYIILTHFGELGTVVERMLSSAFSERSIVGGGIGFLTSRPMREGFARGMLSNEAGAGTSAMAHARSGVLSPSTAGLLGIFEVWFDTGLICILTGLSILLIVPDPTILDGGMQLVMYAMGSVYGAVGKYAVLLCVFAFAFATVICWYYYGTEAWSSLFGRRHRYVFLPIFLLFVILGCYLDSYLLVSTTDALMLLATLLTLSAIMKNSDRVKALSESGGVIDSDSGRLRPFRIKGSVFSKGEKRR